ncbi:MAG: D-serine ammonia-lyase [Solidesulfovibrio sp.]|uniref:D-serine ammonia-lyase n=1 Tax=Solidesulfovibrio sp. TaxID=2910990 RepID=UPI0031596C08
MDAATEAALRAQHPVFWSNPGRRPLEEVRPGLAVGLDDIRAAADRLARFGPLLAALFPGELSRTGGIIESDLIPLGPWAAKGLPAGDAVWLKADHLLPVAGSVKARGGFHAVLRLAETLAREAGLLDGPMGDTTALAGPAAQAFFAGQTLSVGSTGNLGLSIGIMGRALGFAVTVHMSAEAKAWKKARLRAVGATVVEHAGDYAAACAEARQEAAAAPTIHFIDDENSLDLFLGYAVAGLRLPGQLAAGGIEVSRERPLCLHLPCGVGGAPGGIALGARLAFGDAALAFFVEPARAPCMLWGLATGRHDGAHIGELGLDGRTLADGLAVPRPSRLVGRFMEGVCDGVLTVAEVDLPRLVAQAWAQGGLRLEPSAAAALAGPARVRGAGLAALAGRPASHIVWATGGGLLPEADFAAVLALAGEDACS